MLFFDKSFQFIYETYILLAMCSCLNYYHYKWDTSGNRINSLVATILSAVVVCFPLLIMWVYQTMDHFKLIYYAEKDYMNKFGSITKILAVFREGRKVFTYVWAGLLRKLWLVIMVVFM